MNLPVTFEQLSALEWLDANGLGGYASGTVSGAGTRGYHGLLVAAVGPAGARLMTVTGCDEWLVDDPPAYLSSHQYPGAVAPDGWRQLTAFEAAPLPRWTYAAGARRVERRLFMVAGQNTTVVRYRLVDGPPGRLAVRPFFVFRDHHGRRHEDASWHVVASWDGDAIRCAPSDGGTMMWVHAPGASYRDEPYWYHQFQYAIERERGLDDEEDAYAPFVLEFALEPGRDVDLVYTTESVAPAAADELERRETARRAALASAIPDGDAVGRRLAVAADAYLVRRRGGGPTVIAGYPWFTDWGRDTMIGLSGLALVTGRVEEAGRILSTFAAYRRDGLIPNRFPDTGIEPEYNTVDASLWFAIAVRRFLAAGGSPALVDGPLTGALADIVEAYEIGTSYNIREDDDGLVTAGADGVALTWMDARVGDWVVTPRRGKAVEINALWYNARRVLADLVERQGDSERAEELRQRAYRTRDAFRERFVDAATGAVADVIAADGGRDMSCRPNQLFAVALPYPLLPPDQARAVLDVVTRELLTPMGLRSLAPGDPAYRPRYEGDVKARDSAYHQGTVWPWLIGAYADAEWYVNGRTPETRRRVRDALSGLVAHLDAGCIGQVAEIADGDAPYQARGCCAQAWSVAELLRVWRDVAD